MKSLLTLLAAAVVAAPSCTNLTTLSEPSVIGRGEFDMVVAARGTYYGKDAGFSDGFEGVSPSVALLGRIGLSDELELQVRALVPGLFGAGLKVQLVGDSRDTGLSMAIGAELDFVTFDFTLELGGGGDGGQLITDLRVPISIGYRFTADLGVYTTVKPASRLRLGSSVFSTGFFSQSTGVVLGSETRFIFEVSWAWDWMRGGGALADVALGVQF